MAANVIAAVRRPRLSVALVVLALAVAVVVLATQARSIWSTGARSLVRRDSAHVAQARPDSAASRAFVHPGAHRGQVRFGPLPGQDAPKARPHGPNQVPRSGS
jgi:hypothetical protein